MVWEDGGGDPASYPIELFSGGLPPIRFSLLPLGEGPGKRDVAEMVRYSSPLPNPLPKGEGVRTNLLRR